MISTKADVENVVIIIAFLARDPTTKGDSTEQAS